MINSISINHRNHKLRTNHTMHGRRRLHILPYLHSDMNLTEKIVLQITL